MPLRSDDTYCGLPMVTCPHCGHEFQKDDYYDVESGDEWECNHCEKLIFVIFVDHVTTVRLSTQR